MTSTILRKYVFSMPTNHAHGVEIKFNFNFECNSETISIPKSRSQIKENVQGMNAENVLSREFLKRSISSFPYKSYGATIRFIWGITHFLPTITYEGDNRFKEMMAP